jgi:hypothetical protein
MPTDNTTDSVPTAGTDADTNNTLNNPDKPRSWRDVWPVHPAAKLFPEMGEDELQALAADIRNGLREHITLYQDPDLGLCVLDGRNRLNALELLGEVPLDGNGRPTARCHIQKARASFDPLAFVLSKNLHRRHLTPDGRSEVIAGVLKLDPARSNRQIAGQLKTDHHKVAAVRAEREATGEISPVEKTTGKDGKERPARKKAKAPKAAPPAPKKAATSAPKPKRITTALDVLAVWKDLPEAERRRFFDGIGLNAILAGIPEAWLPALEEWIAKRRISAAPRVLQ